MNIKSIIENELVQDPSSVWLLKEHGSFGYSDGIAAEKYLDKVLRSASDLGTLSDELESSIKDWPSEYHLTRKRAQLLSGIGFDRSLKVLEVGCGCGAITRHLGESFDSVVAIEGSLPRARLARLRNRDLPSVSIVCAPFQKIRFSEKFDIVFIIGVYEYSASFVDGEDPYDSVLKYFCDILAPDGMIVVAIENQFGLKYFDGFNEDHLEVPFAGLEGYHRRQAKVRTFGKVELENRFKPYFPELRFFYPYPDYKLPDCVLSSEFLESGRAGELVSQMASRDYSSAVQPLWNEPATVLELSKNRMLEFFSNSFLVIAGRTKLRGVTFDQLGILYSSGRKSEFSTQTRIVQKPDGQWTVLKRSRQGHGVVDGGAIKMVDTDARWLGSRSLATEVALRAMSSDLGIEAIFAPCRKWVELLIAESSVRDGVTYVGGMHVDSILPNVYPNERDQPIVDREWIWHRDIPLNVIIIRALHDFLSKAGRLTGKGKALKVRSGRTLIENISTSIGISLVAKDFDDFVELESEIQRIVFGSDKRRQRIYLRWFLADTPTFNLFLRTKHRVQSILSRLRDRLGLD